MAHQIIIQTAVSEVYSPTQAKIQKWAEASLQTLKEAYEVTVRIVDEEEMTFLNETYRKKKGPTNVLSFPFDAPIELELPILGDIVICAAVVNKEAEQQGKEKDAHWAHMIVHGMFHLRGYDHIETSEAEEMEALEIAVLTKLGYRNPYEDADKAEGHE